MFIAIGMLLFVLGILGTLSLPATFVSDYTHGEKLQLVACVVSFTTGAVLLILGLLVMVMKWHGSL